eukprot:jgi/Psemu1/302036/fgenesh1_kg.56_\
MAVPVPSLGISGAVKFLVHVGVAGGAVAVATATTWGIPTRITAEEILQSEATSKGHVQELATVGFFLGWVGLGSQRGSNRREFQKRETE